VLLAQEIVARFHSHAAAERALAEFEARFREGAMPEDMPEFSFQASVDPTAVTAVLKASGLTASTSEAMRMIDQGGVKIDGEKVTDKALQLAAGRTVVMQVGKRKFARVTIK